MASLLYGRVLVCMLIFATIIASYTANHGALSNGFKILSEGEYSKVVNANCLSRKAAVQCNFDKGWCGFHNEKVGDNFDWTLRSRSTPSAQTGPSSDISGKGSYAYIETSVPQRPGHKARLLTPVLPGKVYCLQFGFHAYGNNIGALVVHRKDSGGRKYFLLKLEKNYGKKWLHVVGTIAHPNRFQIEFEGIRGNGYRGDIALDNIVITAGKCHDITGKNETGKCGFGYPGLSAALSSFPPFNSWPWIVSLLPSRQHQPLCTAAYVRNDWVLTSKTCARKLTRHNITTYRGDGNTEQRRSVVKEHSSKMSETVLLRLSKPTSKSVMDKVCLPTPIPSSLFGPRSLKVCYLLAISFSVKVKIMEESTVTILPMNICAPYLRSARWKHIDKRRLLCVQPASSFKVKPTVSEIDGYVVCKNKISPQRWILHGVGSFSYLNITGRPLIFTHVSNMLDWIEKIINFPLIPVPKLPPVITPEPPKEPSRGFQIFEQTKHKCLAFVSKIRSFVYQTCNIYDISQRFDWSLQNQILILKTNLCLMSGGFPYYYLGAARCYATRKSQKWTCMENRIRNNFHKKWFISFGLEEKADRVRLIDEVLQKGNYVIYGTQDNVCSSRKTVSGIFRCNSDSDPMCGFENTNGNSQFTWTDRKPNVSEMKVSPGLRSSDKIFETIRRGRGGDKAAMLSSRWFHGQRCVQFYSYLDGSHHDQLRIIKYERGRRKTLLRISGAGKGQQHWLLHRVTFSPKLCETYQVLFQAFLPIGGNTKVGIRDVQVFTGACEPTSDKIDGKCLKGWRFYKGSCFYPYDIKTSWHQALAVCQITGADLPTDIVVSKLIPRGDSSWFGIRSCPNGRTYSTKAIQYQHKHTSAKATCLQLHMSTTRGPVYKSGSCDLKLPFVCQKEPEKTETSCGVMNSSSIANGPTSTVVDADRQWRWHVVIVMLRKCECGGTLVAPGYVVTSSLCVSRVPLGIIKIFIPSSRSVIHKITRVIYHPKFGLKSGDNDIAIIMFEENFLSTLSIHFACVNKMTKIWKERKSSKNDLLKDSRCFVLGWGTYRGGFATCGPKTYKVHEVEILERAQCEEHYGKHIMTERMLCARPRSPGKRTCLGDTGGPLVCDIAGAWTLVGVTIWGTGCTETRKYGIYTDVASMKSWMDEVTSVNI